MTDEPHIRAAIERLRRRDITGLAVLVKAYQIKALRAAFLMIHDKAIAEEIVQNAFVRAYEQIGQYRMKQPFSAWFFRRVVQDALVIARTQPHIRSSDVLTPHTPTTYPDSLDVVPPDKVHQHLRTTLQDMTPEERATVVLRDYLGLIEHSEAILTKPTMGEA